MRRVLQVLAVLAVLAVPSVGHACRCLATPGYPSRNGIWFEGEALGTVTDGDQEFMSSRVVRSWGELVPSTILVVIPDPAKQNWDCASERAPEPGEHFIATYDRRNANAWLVTTHRCDFVPSWGRNFVPHDPDEFEKVVARLDKYLTSYRGTPVPRGAWLAWRLAEVLIPQVSAFARRNLHVNTAADEWPWPLR